MATKKLMGSITRNRLSDEIIDLLEDLDPDGVQDVEVDREADTETILFGHDGQFAFQITIARLF